MKRPQFTLRQMALLSLFFCIAMSSMRVAEWGSQEAGEAVMLAGTGGMAAALGGAIWTFYGHPIRSLAIGCALFMAGVFWLFFALMIASRLFPNYIRFDLQNLAASAGPL